MLAPHTHRPRLLALTLALLLLGLLSNTFYLWHNCPLDFSEDESHYWEWARHLDYGYYSKPPGIAWTLAAALRLGQLLHLTGDNSGAALMPLLRMPAVLFATLSGLLSALLARRIFKDDRAALAVTALSAAVPMFAVGSLLITIDSPMYLAWAATLYCLWRVVESSGQSSVASGQNPEPSSLTTDHWRLATRWMIAAGLACSIGMLFKPVLIALPLCALVAAYVDPLLRRAFLTKSALIALLLVLASQIPVILWNAHHHWVTFLHISTQGGLTGTEPTPLLRRVSRMAEYVAGQAGGMGALPFILLTAAIITTLKHLRQKPTPNTERPTPNDASPSDHWPLTTDHAYRFLLSFSLPLWLFYFLLSFWKGTEINWPAASYFTGMILLAGVVVQKWPTSKPWRTWTLTTITVGFTLTLAAMNLQRLYPLLAPKLAALPPEKHDKSFLFPGKWDPAAKKLRGFNQRAQLVEQERAAFEKDTGKPPLIVTGRYDLSSSLAFYMPNHPFVLSIMSAVGGRQNQYDLWPGLNDQNPDHTFVHAGENVLLVGNFDDAAFTSTLVPAFSRIDPPITLPISIDGITLRYVTTRRAYNFQGLPKFPSTTTY
jgi:4-amino-4-deoxy-L-arabinose transferase-like glycosyltransferase